jgi:hypothetical protein
VDAGSLHLKGRPLARITGLERLLQPRRVKYDPVVRFSKWTFGFSSRSCSARIPAC